MLMAISNSSKWSATPRRASRLGRRTRTWFPRSPAKPTNTPTCIRVWRGRPARKVSTRSPIGSRPWPKPRRATPDASKRRSTPSASKAEYRTGDHRIDSAKRGPWIMVPEAADICAPPPESISDMSHEGSLEAPTRHPIDWRNEEFYDPAKLETEMRRVFEICHGCRRCFNLCDSFPRLFDLIDSNPTEDVEGVKTEDFSKVTEACTLCDMCFMTKCPYVPPHPWQVDFPHLLLRHRIVNARDSKTGFTARQLAEMDRNGQMVRPIAPLANWASAKGNALTRPLMERTLGIDAHAELPK